MNINICDFTNNGDKNINVLRNKTQDMNKSPYKSADNFKIQKHMKYPEHTIL